MTTELFGAAQEINFIDIVLRDAVCDIRMAVLSGADVAQFRNRMKTDGYAPSTIVPRLNLIARAIGVARLEWGINIPANPADAEHCAGPTSSVKEHSCRRPRRRFFRRQPTPQGRAKINPGS